MGIAPLRPRGLDHSFTGSFNSHSGCSIHRTTFRDRQYRQLGTASPAYDDKDCCDSPNQAAAQDYFLDHGGPQSDPDGLDADGDGIACESNPCPCNYGTGGGGGGGGGGTPPLKPKRQIAKVVRVIDGDTPESQAVRSGDAKRNAKKLLPKGKRVILLSDTSQSLQDRYGRLLRYAKSPKSPERSKGLIKRGFGKVYVVGKPFKRVGAYRSAQGQAKRQDKGLWDKCW